MKEKLEILEKEIRKALPRLMKLSEGCKVFFENADGEIENGRIIDTDSYCLSVVCYGYDYAVSKEEHEVMIIGHDILLSDVLEWLQQKTGADVYFTNETFELSIRYHNGIDVSRKYIKWDLSKPYLKDQSEELIGFLYNLI